MGLAHLRVPQMHLPIEMVGQAPIIIQPAQVGTTHIADLQLLMPARPARIVQVLEVALLVGAGVQGLLQLVMLLDGERDAAHLAHGLDLQQARLDGAVEAADRLQQRVRLPDLVRVLLEPALHAVDAPVAFVDVLAHLPEIVEVEAPPFLLLGRGFLVFGPQRFRVRSRAGADVLLGVREEVVRTCAH